MRISVDRKDSGFRPGILACSKYGESAPPRERYDVFLDDEKLDDVVTADEEQGIVIVRARDGDGDLRHRDGILLNEVRRGDVRIERLP